MNMKDTKKKKKQENTQYQYKQYKDALNDFTIRRRCHHF